MRPEEKAAALGVAVGSKAASACSSTSTTMRSSGSHGTVYVILGNDGGYEGDGDAGLRMYTFPPGPLRDLVDPHVGIVGG